MEVIKDKNHPPLSKAETKEAKKDLIRYPLVIRDDKDPAYLDQHYAVVSFKFFDPPKEDKNGKKIYGIFKLRGSRPTKKKAEKRAEEIIRELDSVNKCKILEVGSWAYVSDDHHLESIEIKEDEDFKVEKKDERKEQDIMKELHDRTSEISKNEHMKGDPPLERYCRNKTVSMQIQKQMRTYIERLKQAEKEMKEEEERNPNVVDEWIPYMNQERRKVGLKEIRSEKDLID
jgi:hypothetical protein